MTRHAALAALGGPLLLVSACQSGNAPAANDDPSKLSAELETEARAIEQRAADAVQAADRAAAADLQQLDAETRANAAVTADVDAMVSGAGAASELPSRPAGSDQDAAPQRSTPQP